MFVITENILKHSALFTLYEGRVSASVERSCGADDDEYVQFLSGFVTSQWVPSDKNGTFRYKEC